MYVCMYLEREIEFPDIKFSDGDFSPTAFTMASSFFFLVQRIIHA